MNVLNIDSRIENIEAELQALKDLCHKTKRRKQAAVSTGATSPHIDQIVANKRKQLRERLYKKATDNQ